MDHDCLSTGARLSLFNCKVEEGFISFAWGLILPGKKPDKMAIADIDNGTTYQLLIPPSWQDNQDTIAVYDSKIEIYEQKETQT